MINCKPYQQSYTSDIQRAFIARDDAFFHREIKRLCRIVANRPNDFDNSVDYDNVTSRLHVCLALVDSLVRHGDTSKLMGDIVNF